MPHAPLIRGACGVYPACSLYSAHAVLAVRLFTPVLLYLRVREAVYSALVREVGPKGTTDLGCAN